MQLINFITVHYLYINMDFELTKAKWAKNMQFLPNF